MTGDMESSSDECIGIATTSMQQSIHWDISGTPSLQQLLEERTLSTQTVVTCVGFRESFYTVLETTMPMFGSTSGGKSGTGSAPEKEDTAAFNGVKSKEDADHGPHAPIPATTRAHQGRHPPKEALQTFVPENALHYYLE